MGFFRIKTFFMHLTSSFVKMLPFELNIKICKNLSFLEVNRFATAVGLHQNTDLRIVNDKPGLFICPICLHGKINLIMKEVFQIQENSAEFRGMR